MKIIIVGAGQVGGYLAKMLSTEYHDITVVDSSEERLERISESADVITLFGRPTSIETLRLAGVEKADLFIAVSPAEDQEINIVSAILAKKLGIQKVIARVNNEEYMNNENKLLFTEMGIDLLFYPEQIAANEIFDLLKQSGTSEYTDFANGKLQLISFRVDENSPVMDRVMSEFKKDDDLQFRVVAVARDGYTIIPDNDTRFRLHDLVFIISLRDGVAEALSYSGKRNFEVKNLMILGGGRIGEMLARRLENIVEDIKLIDSDKSRSEELSEILDKTLVIHGDGRNSDLLLEEDIKRFDAFVAVTSSSETNILACVAAKNFGVPKVIAKVENNDYIKLAERMGVDSVINKKLLTAGRIFRFTMSNKVRLVKYLSGSNAELIEFNVNPNSKITTDIVKNLDFPGEAIIGGLIRKNESYIVTGSTQIEAYDRVVVFALPSVVNKVDKFFI